MIKANKQRQRIGIDFLGRRYKPKGMHWRTFDRLLQEYKLTELANQAHFARWADAMQLSIAKLRRGK